MKYIKKLAEKKLWNAGYVELYDFSHANQNEESRIEAVATVASICYGKPPKDAKKLVERLWTESNGLPSSAFEFVRYPLWPTIEWSLRNKPDLFTDEEQAMGLSLECYRAVHLGTIATFRLKIPIFLARQVMRHRQFSYQELSRRYTTDEKVPLEFWKPGDIKWHTSATAVGEYEWLLEVGMRPEIARAVLPQSLYTEFWIMGDKEAWKNYFALRTDKHAQKEHRGLAEAMLGLLKEHQPELYEEVRPQGEIADKT